MGNSEDSGVWYILETSSSSESSQNKQTYKSNIVQEYMHYHTPRHYLARQIRRAEEMQNYANMYYLQWE